MGMPNINVIFRSTAKTIEDRSDNGTVALLLASNANLTQKEYRPGDDIDKAIVADSKTQIEFALKGGRDKPKKVICIFCQAEYEDIDTALEKLETEKFDYLTFGSTLDEEKKTKVVNWVKEERKAGRKIKAVLANKEADCEGIINYVTESVTVGGKDYTTDMFCSRIAGLLAGTLLTMSSTYTVLNDAENCTKLSQKEMDEQVNAGKFIVFRDGDYIRVARGVNSLQTIDENKNESFKKIKIVNTMDRITTDLTNLIKNNWLGQYSNSYNNKCLLVSACQEYMNELTQRGILETAVIEIDVEGNKKYLEENGIKTTDMTEEELKKANTGEHVFLKATISILDAMEDFDIEITV